MRNLSFIVLLIGITVNLYSQDPHGDDFDLDCEMCHGIENWNVDPLKIEFDHGSTKFELTGQHQAANCRSCHTTLVFSSSDPDCISCHTDLHQGTVGKDCSKCHTSNSWIVEDINQLHQTGRFPLLGKHLVTDCAQCHSGYVDLNFEPLNTDCYSCHSTDYLSTSSPNHANAGFSTYCQDCHPLNAFSWSAINVVHDFFPLAGGHSVSDCFACHNQGGDFSGLSNDCYSCHQQDYEAVNDPKHILGNFPTDCVQCHTINAWIPASFDHSVTAFPLSGKHITVDCSQCHSSGFAGTPTECYACHQTDYENVSDPNHVTAGFSIDCVECHTTTGWDGASFDHNITGFELTGAHIGLDCLNCHASGFTGTPTDCFSCHEDDYNNTINPNHISAQFPTSCDDCHSTIAWQPATFDHDGLYFPIYSGKHNEEWNDCTDCHNVPSNYSVFTCIDCHEHNRQDMDEEHSGVSGYIYASTECLACHPDGSEGSGFDHALSNFPLTGAHVTVDCEGCHHNGYAGTPTDCFACHETDYNNSTNPDHQVLSLSTDCISCHSTEPEWQPAQFPQHNQVFELLGRHLEIANDCALCHNGNYNNTPVTCFECHTDAYNNATNPNHQTAGIPTDCESCHNSSAWAPSTFDHSSTGFVLEGAHSSTQCSNCHQGTTTGLQSDCFSCHEDAYNNSTNPEHVSAGLSTLCEECHTAVAWIPSTFDHTSAGFELVGAHATIQCSDCHQGTTTGLQSDCFSCHEDDYNSAPDHSTLNYPINCEICHNSITWEDVIFDHANTNFPLTGAHTSLNCDDCHSTGYTGTSTICYECHQTAYEQTTNPNHVTLSLSTDCETCHTTDPNWEPATFPVHNNYFELLGAHTLINNCDDCHNGNYNNTPNTCMGCHAIDYNGTNDPPHQSLGFPEDCLICHDMNGWEPASFDHAFYPISSDHNNVDCNECHSEPGYQPQCMSCHNDDFLEEHDPGDPTDCWSCHDTFDWDTGLRKSQMQNAH